MHRCVNSIPQEWRGLRYRFHMHTHDRTPVPQSSRIHSKNCIAQRSFPIQALCRFHTSLAFRFLCRQSLVWVFFFCFKFFSSPNSFEMVFGENPFGCSSCPCISSHSQTCSLPSDTGQNKRPTYRNTWNTPSTLQQHKLGKNPESPREKRPRGNVRGHEENRGLEAGKSVAAGFTGTLGRAL